MQNTIRFQTENQLDSDSLFLSSLLLRDVNRIVRDVQTIVAVLLRYAALGISIANNLIEWIAPRHVSELEGEILT